MSDEDDDQLLYFWNQTWHEAGWTPVILTKEDAERHADFRNIQEETFAADSFAKVLVNRWLAMAAVGGGWYADYDVFPLREFSSENQAMKQMTVHDICSPTLASGSADEWLLTLQTLLEEARERYSTSSFWTDCLGITRLISNNHQHRPKTEKRVAMPYDRNDPVISNNSADCSARNFRSRWVVHFGPTMLQTAKSVPPSKRHPKYRLALAKDWLSRWNEICSEVVLESK